jgi:carbonic anhydrase
MVRSHPWIAKDVPVRGFVFDMATGLLKEVHAKVLLDRAERSP